MNATATDTLALIQAGFSREFAGDFAGAEVLYRRAIATPGSPGAAKIFLSLLLLGRGDYAQGLTLLESRPLTQCNGPAPPLWRGERLRGRSITVMPDSDGLGDKIMFARFVRNLKARGAGRVVVVAPRALKRLFERVAGVYSVIALDDSGHANLTERTDYRVGMASLLHLFSVRAASIPTSPYISAAPSDVERWRLKLPQSPVRVGLVWRGDPNNPREPGRSLPSLAALAPLWQVPDVAFVSLQKGAGEDEARAGLTRQPLTHLGSDVRDYADTVAILQQLDLLVTTDTSIAHAAGALGKPVWLLLQHVPDWRWREGAGVWYPTVRQFRQHTQGDWSGAIDDVAAALSALGQCPAPRAIRDTLQVP